MKNALVAEQEQVRNESAGERQMGSSQPDFLPETHMHKGQQEKVNALTW